MSPVHGPTVSSERRTSLADSLHAREERSDFEARGQVYGVNLYPLSPFSNGPLLGKPS